LVGHRVYVGLRALVEDSVARLLRRRRGIRTESGAALGDGWRGGELRHVGGGGRVTVFCFFFFQAEDGIRDRTVTGVQTCALPIYRRDHGPVLALRRPGLGLHLRVLLSLVGGARSSTWTTQSIHTALLPVARKTAHRSEERRVGKECRSRWEADHEKKKRDVRTRRE